MSERIADVRLASDLAEAPRPSAVPVEDRAFSIAILGDFSGRGTRNTDGEGASAPTPHLVDRDDFDAVLARISPLLHLRPQPGERPIELRFRDLDDFHPDALFGRLPLFRELRDLRERLADPATFARAAAELRAEGPGDRPSEATQSGSGEDSLVEPVPMDGLLDRIVDETAPPKSGEPDPIGNPLSDRDFQSYIRRLLAPHRVEEADPRQAELLDRVDAATSEQMRALLHDPGFQSLEALWRSVFLLTRRLSTGVFLRLYLVDVSRDALGAAVGTPEDPDSPLVHLLSTGPEGGARGPWGLLVGSYAFGREEEDLALLGALARVAARAGAPWISSATPGLVGCDDPSELVHAGDWAPPIDGWEALRRRPEARWLGLAMPRFLARLPYGANADPCERFRFEESEGEMDKGDYLWADPALACALLLGQAFDRDGWRLLPGSVREIGGLPLHLVQSDGGPTALPCAEVRLPDEAIDRLLETGVMPLASPKDRDAVRLVRFQSIARPPAPLAGAWADAGAGVPS